MPITASLLPEFDHELANLRKTLERVPDDKLAWKPHPKSATMGWLASHLAVLPMWAVHTLDRTELDLAPPDGSAIPRPPEAKNNAELLVLFDKNRADARAAIEKATDDDWMVAWSLLMGGRTLMTMPRVACVRSWVMNHMIHHRAQLGVYLRLNDLPVPAIYGPSADEGQMGQ